MVRKLPVEYPGAIYHPMNRGDRLEPIFRDDEDRERFLVTLGQGCFKTGWQVHAHWLMPNPFHLVRAQTTVTLRWIAARLCIGTRGHLTHLLYWHTRQRVSSRLSRKSRSIPSLRCEVTELEQS